jgi:hypothetical protein
LSPDRGSNASATGTANRAASLHEAFFGLVILAALIVIVLAMKRWDD